MRSGLCSGLFQTDDRTSRRPGRLRVEGGMTQAYGPAFAEVYRRAWEGFAVEVAPAILTCFTSGASSDLPRTLLDVGCGTGALARYFLRAGFDVTGLDLSEAMLSVASRETADYMALGQARFLHANAATFELDGPFSLVVSTYDALNHLSGIEELE